MAAKGRGMTPEQKARVNLQRAASPRQWEFAREPDALTGYDELVVRARADEDNKPVVPKPT